MSVHTDAQNTRCKNVVVFLHLWLVFFGLTFHFKNWSTNEIGSFAHVHGAAEVTVKHDLVALKHKMVLQSTHCYRTTRRGSM